MKISCRLILVLNNNSFVAEMSANPRFVRKDIGMVEFMVKLPYTTAGWHNNTIKSSANGVDGILTSIRGFMNNDRVNGYIDEVIIQPYWQMNTEAQVVCFNGDPRYRNKNKIGKKSGLKKATDAVCFEFAQRVIRELKAAAPELIADGILRIDFFGEPLPDGSISFIVNEIEGYEACAWGTGANAGDKSMQLYESIKKYWKSTVDVMIECYIEHQRNECLRRRIS